VIAAKTVCPAKVDKAFYGNATRLAPLHTGGRKLSESIGNAVGMLILSYKNKQML